MKSKAIIIFFLFCILTGKMTYAQLGWKWALAEQCIASGCTNESSGLDVVVDSLNNSYVTGYFRDHMQFGNIEINSVATNDIFVAKVNSNGELCWIKQFGENGDNYGNSIALDKKLNIYVTGGYNNNQKAIVIKLDKNGNIKWQKLIDSGYHWESKRKTITFSKEKLLVASSDSLYVFDTLGQQISSIRTNAVCISHSESGKFIAATNQKIQIFTPDLHIEKEFIIPKGIESINALTFNGSNIYFTGLFDGELVVGDSIFNGYMDMFIIKMDTSGTYKWANRGGGDSWDMGNAIVINSDNQIFVTGFYRNIAIFDSITVGREGLFEEIFVAEYDNKNGKLLDLITAGGPGDYDIGYAIAETMDKQLIVTGSINDFLGKGVNFGDILVHSFNGAKDFFLAKTFCPEIKSTIKGQVLKSGIPVYANFKLFKYNNDSSLKLIYNSQTDADGKFDLSLSNKGTYILKALFNSTTHTSTYYENTYLWNLATPIEIRSDTLINSLIINLIELPVLDGTNTITGSISDSVGELKSFIDLLLVSKDSIPIAYTQSDSLGFYEFTNIPGGEFNILVDSAGLFMDSYYTIKTALKSLLTEYNGYDFIIKGGKIFTSRYVLGIDNKPTINKDILIYPVPTKNLLFIKRLNGNYSDLSLAIIDLSGKIVKKINVIENNKIDVSELKDGVYFVRIFNGNARVYQKIIIKR